MSNKARLTIGAFAEATMLSHKALRLYDESGLLAPAEVDPFSGYRYYTPDQTHAGRLIAMLRAADMPLAQIREFLEYYESDLAAAGQVLDQHLLTVHRHAASTRTLLAQARARLTGEAMDNVITTVEQDQPVLSTMIHTTVENLGREVENALARLMAVAAAKALNVASDPFGIFHGEVSQGSDGPLEVCLPVDALLHSQRSPGQADDAVRSYRLTGGRFAVVTAEGEDTEFPAILAAYDQTGSWIEATGAVRVGPPREIWHVLPDLAKPCRMSVAWPYA
jgi:DNA-binding transcriptional MerR regulator